MTGTSLRSIAALLIAVVLVVGCSSSSISAPLEPTDLPSAIASPPAQASTTPRAPTATPTTPSPAAPTRSPAATTVTADMVAVTVVKGVRVRSQPRVGDDSYMEEPLLSIGTELYVLDGPVSASGYDWYEVAPLTSRTLPSGWIASAGRDGEPWIAAGGFDCPPVPTDFRSLAALPAGVGLACFPQVPITVRARVIWCSCDIDGAWYTPWWFSRNENPHLLVEPDSTSPPPDWADWFGLNLDPAGQHPEAVPEGKVVEVTGIFDHPAAASCTVTEMDGKPVPSQGCRLEFAVTQMRVVGP